MIKKSSLWIGLLIITIFICIYMYKAQTSPVKWSIRNQPQKAFWIGNNTIGIISIGKLTVIDLNGKVLWEKQIEEKTTVTEKLKLLSPTGSLTALSKKGDIVWENNNSNIVSIFEGPDDSFILKTNNNELLIFSEGYKFSWKTNIQSFVPLTVFKSNKIIGMYWSNNKIEVQMIDSSNKMQTITNLTEPAFFEGDLPFISYNKYTKNTLISGITSWWAIIADSGQILINNNKLPIRTVNYTTSCGSGFAFASINENKVVAVNNDGKVLWSKQFDKIINGITGNLNYLSVSVGNTGYLGKIFLLDANNGKQISSIELTNSFNAIQIDDSSSKVIGVIKYSKVELLDF